MAASLAVAITVSAKEKKTVESKLVSSFTQKFIYFLNQSTLMTAISFSKIGRLNLPRQEPTPPLLKMH